MTRARGFEEAREVVGVVLPVAVHERDVRDVVPEEHGEPVAERAPLPAVPLARQHAGSRLARLPGRAVAAAVVDHEDAGNVREKSQHDAADAAFAAVSRDERGGAEADVRPRVGKEGH